MYSSDLEQTLRYLAQTVAQLFAKQSAATQELCTTAFGVYHRYVLFAAALQYYARPGEIDEQLRAIGHRPQNSMYETFEKFPDVLDFFYSLLSSAFMNNPYYTELVYSVLECIIVSALPYEPVVKFVSARLFVSSPGRYQDLLLLNSVCAAPALCEAVVEHMGAEEKAAMYSSLFKPPTVDARLARLFVTCQLCRSSAKNRLVLEAQTNPLEFVGSFGFDKCSEAQQLLVLELMRELVHGKIGEEDTIDYAVLTKGPDKKEIDLLMNIRGEVRSAYKSITMASKPILTGSNTTIQDPPTTNLHNLLLLLVVNSTPAVQSRILLELAQDLDSSRSLCLVWMRLETVDSLMEVYQCLEDSEDPLRAQYLAMISRILSRGVSLAKPELLRSLVGSSREFQLAVLNILEEEDPPLSLSVDSDSVQGGYISTLPLRYFPREKVGFSLTFWAKYSAIASGTTLFELIGEKEPILACKYVVSGSASRASSGSQVQGEAGSARGESLIKYAVVVESEGTAGMCRIELEAPLLESGKMTHVAIQYSRGAHSGYINGKQVYCSKQGTQNAYPMTLAKGLRLRFAAGQFRAISTVSLYEGAIDAKAVAGMWLRGPIDEYTSTQKELGIDLPRLYRFPKPTKERKEDLPGKKLVVSAAKDEGFRCLGYPLSAEYLDFHPEYTEKLRCPPDSEFISPNTKGVKGPDFEVSGATTVVLSHTVTLKEHLSTPEFVRTVLGRLSGTGLKQCVDSAEFATLLQILELLTIRNEKFVAGLLKEFSLSDTLVQLSSLRHVSSPDWHADLQAIFSVLFDLLCGQRSVMRELNVFSKPRLLSLPVLHPTRFDYFRAIKCLAVMSPRSQCETVLNVLSNLLVRQENAEKLAAEGLLTMLLQLLGQTHALTRDSDSGSFLYEKLLEVLQLFFHWNHILDWDLLFSFFLVLKDREDARSQDILADLLSILSVYVFVGGNRVALAEKFVSANGLKVRQRSLTPA